jgi:hypothetical protein
MTFERQLGIALLPIFILFAVWLFFFCKGLWQAYPNDKCALGHSGCQDCANCVYCGREWEKENLNGI